MAYLLRVGGNLGSHGKFGSAAVRTTSRSALQWNDNVTVGKDPQTSITAFLIKRVRREIKTLYGDRGQAEAGGFRRSPPYPLACGDGQRSTGAGKNMRSPM